MDNKRRKVGLRVVSHPVTRAIVEELGRPLLTTSAILPGQEACNDADMIVETFGKDLDLLIDSGPTLEDVSTVIEVDGEEISIVRQGAGQIPDAEFIL